MTKTAYIYFDKKGKKCLYTKVLHKSKKGMYRGDIIELGMIGSFDKRDYKRLFLTPKEAVLVSTSLLQAVVVYNNKRKNGNKREEWKMKNDDTQ